MSKEVIEELPKPIQNFIEAEKKADKMEQKKKYSEEEEKLIKIIGEKPFEKLTDSIPEKIRPDMIVDFTNHLLQMPEQEILNFYTRIIRDPSATSTLNIVGIVMVLSTQIEDLLLKLIEVYDGKQLKRKAKKFSFHNLIILCTAKYGIPKEHFIQMMELRHLRNIVAHEFNTIMSTGLKNPVRVIHNGQLVMMYLVLMIKDKMDPKRKVKILKKIWGVE
jgi:hypothetical protein